MSNRFTCLRWHMRLSRAVSIAVNYMLELFSFKRRMLSRQNAIRVAIASLIETERMRLAMTIGHRDHN
ncbi:MAG TPA: hypothetical protein VMF50_10045 [Candidatus Binataceae bacterium]|nr:hypothetical protein [Candidatus Binataceae bacterium]